MGKLQEISDLKKAGKSTIELEKEFEGLSEIGKNRCF